DAWVYGHQRIDILIITISGAGVYVCLETVKYLKDNSEKVHWLVMASGILFLLAIILNLVSQWYSTRIQFHDFEICEYCIQSDDETLEKCMGEIKRRELIIKDIEDKLAYVTEASFISMVLATISILIFFFAFI